MIQVIVLTFLLIASVFSSTFAADDQQKMAARFPESAKSIPAVTEHRRSKRSPYDPLIPALLLGKSAFLLGTVLGPSLLHRPYSYRRPRYLRSFHGHGGGYNGGYGHAGYSSRGWGWK